MQYSKMKHNKFKNENVSEADGGSSKLGRHMKIEEITFKDIDSIKIIAKKAVFESVDASSELKEEIISDTMKHIGKGISNQDCVFLKYTADKILGFILIQSYWNLSDLFVLSEAHGKGIGKALFDAAKNLCRARQDKGYILVNSSLNAEDFYRNIGFESFTPKREVSSFVVPLIYNFQQVCQCDR